MSHFSFRRIIVKNKRKNFHYYVMIILFHFTNNFQKVHRGIQRESIYSGPISAEKRRMVQQV
jgi:hypothetical protein